MVRVSAILVAVCMAFIAGLLGGVLYLRFGFTGAESALAGLALLTAFAVYDAIAARQRDRDEMTNQAADLARGVADLARQLAEYGSRLNAMDARVENVLDRALTAAQPLAAEIEKLSRLIKEPRRSVVVQETAPGADGGLTSALQLPPAPALSVAATAASKLAHAAAAASDGRSAAAGVGLDKEAIVALIGGAIEANRIDLYLQPIVSLPQRKVRYYEAMLRLRAESGDIVAAGDFLSSAEAGPLLSKLDHLSVVRCVQVVRHLLLKNRDIGVFCNLSSATLTDAGFRRLLEFVDVNRAIAASLVFEFTQGAVRAMGSSEHESLAALSERGFRFSMDHLSDLRAEPRELAERGFRFIKSPAALLLDRLGVALTDVHPADFSDLLGRFGIDLIAERIESESTVVDLLDYDVRFGQGSLFSPPRLVRAEALQTGAADVAKVAHAKVETAAAATQSDEIASSAGMVSGGN